MADAKSTPSYSSDLHFLGFQYRPDRGALILLADYGDLQLLPEVDHLPQIEVPYPITNGGQQF